MWLYSLTFNPTKQFVGNFTCQPYLSLGPSFLLFLIGANWICSFTTFGHESQSDYFFKSIKLPLTSWLLDLKRNVPDISLNTDTLKKNNIKM